MKFVDPGQAIDLQAKWLKVFEETITKRSK
jgi:hypothetical protein